MINDDCDRCAGPNPAPAAERVTCYYGCQHWQCARCAQQTVQERADGDRRNVHTRLVQPSRRSKP